MDTQEEAPGRRAPSKSPDSDVIERKREKKRQIITRHLDQDQQEVVSRWLDTVKYTDEARGADAHFVKNMILFTFCLIKYAKFETSSTGRVDKISDFDKPSPHLCVADYLSHASRIIIDSNQLSSKKAAFINKIYGKEGAQGMYPGLDSRASTHVLERDRDGNLTEQKSALHGAGETVKNFVKTVGSIGNIAEYARQIGVSGPDTTDYGIDVLMGGKGQVNLSGGYSELGKDGHFLIHHSDGILFGLEQSKPSGTHQDMQDVLASVTEGVSGLIRTAFSFSSLDTMTSSESHDSPSARTPSPSAQTPSPDSHDGDPSQGLSGAHSMVGASDDYTAAGSLYFSNLIYKLKLLEERGALVPKKYNGMRVVLSEASFNETYQKFRELKTSDNLDELFQALLESIPNHARATTHDPIPLDEKYLILFDGETKKSIADFVKQIKSVGGKTDDFSTLLGGMLEGIKPWVSYFLRGGELPELNALTYLYNFKSEQPNIEQLRCMLNDTVLIIRKKAVIEISALLAETGPIEKAQLLLDQYHALGDELDESNEFSVYHQLKNILEERSAFVITCEDYLARLDHGTHSASSVPSENKDNLASENCPLTYLCSLRQLDQVVKTLISSNEARIILRLLPAPSHQNTSTMMRQAVQTTRLDLDTKLDPNQEQEQDPNSDSQFR